MGEVDQHSGRDPVRKACLGTSEEGKLEGKPGNQEMGEEDAAHVHKIKGWSELKRWPGGERMGVRCGKAQQFKESWMWEVNGREKSWWTVAGIPVWQSGIWGYDWPRRGGRGMGEREQEDWGGRERSSAWEVELSTIGCTCERRSGRVARVNSAVFVKYLLFARGSSQCLASIRTQDRESTPENSHLSCPFCTNAGKTVNTHCIMSFNYMLESDKFLEKEK